MTDRNIKPCKWYYCCPIKEYTEKGNLERYWIENYCLVNNNECIRYQMQEKGKYHPDNLLPNGEIREDLQWNGNVSIIAQEIAKRFQEEQN